MNIRVEGFLYKEVYSITLTGEKFEPNSVTILTSIFINQLLIEMLQFFLVPLLMIVKFPNYSSVHFLEFCFWSSSLGNLKQVTYNYYTDYPSKCVLLFWVAQCHNYLMSRSSIITTLIIPVKVCYYSELHSAIIISWECNIAPSKVIYVL